jgi:MFS family permease
MELVQSYNQTDMEWSSSSLKPWIVCFCASLFFFYEFIQGNMFASISDNIMHDFNVQIDKVAYLSSIYYLSNVVFLFVAGMMLDRFATKKTMSGAMLLCVIGTFLLAHTESFYMALFCRFLTGIGSAFCFIGPIRIASRWFPSCKMALVTGVIVTIAMTGGMLAQYPLTKMVGYFGWRESLSLVGWLGLGLLALMQIGIKDNPNVSVPSKSVPKMSLLLIAKTAYYNTQSLRAALYTSLMNMGVAVFGAMLGSLYLVQRLGVSKEEASLVNTMLFLGVILGGPFMGWLSDRMGVRVFPMKLGAMFSLFVILGIMYLPVSLTTMGLLFFCLGFFTASQVISYALVAESSPKEMTATAVSLISILTQGGYIVYQNGFSWMLQNVGEIHMVDNISTYSLASYQHAAILFPLAFLLAWSVITSLRETYCKQVGQ